MKIRKAAALLAAVVLSLAGCGGQTQKPEQTAKPQPAPEQQPEQKDSMPTNPNRWDTPGGSDRKGGEARDRPPYEVGLVHEGDIPLLKDADITILVSAEDNEPGKKVLEMIGWDVLAHLEESYRVASFVYRDGETSKELAAGVFAADVIDAYVRYQGAEIDVFTDEVPAGGDVSVITYYTS
jgi:hypothetical protein